MAEDELSSSWRYRQMIEHDGPTLLGFDQDEWARLGDYNAWNARDALEMFRLLRQANLRMFEKLTPGSGSVTACTRSAADHRRGPGAPHGRARRESHRADSKDTRGVERPHPSQRKAGMGHPQKISN